MAADIGFTISVVENVRLTRFSNTEAKRSWFVLSGVCSFFGTSFRLNGEFRKRLARSCRCLFCPVLSTSYWVADRIGVRIPEQKPLRVQSLALGVRLFRINHAIEHMRE